MREGGGPLCQLSAPLELWQLCESGRKLSRETPEAAARVTCLQGDWVVTLVILCSCPVAVYLAQLHCERELSSSIVESFASFPLYVIIVAVCCCMIHLVLLSFLFCSSIVNEEEDETHERTGESACIKTEDGACCSQLLRSSQEGL